MATQVGFNDSLTWGAVSGAGSYDVEVQELGGTSLATVSVPSNIVTVDDLFDGIDFGTYNVRVRAVDGDSRPGAWSTFASFELIGLPAPTGLAKV